MDGGEERGEERRKAVVAALDGVLEEGEVFVVARSGDELLAVVPTSPAAEAARR